MLPMTSSVVPLHLFGQMNGNEAEHDFLFCHMINLLMHWHCVMLMTLSMAWLHLLAQNYEKEVLHDSLVM